jgi:flavin reductase (DIM6/NTAB) family NADH-FMN oxidoreductase RutF
MERVDSPPPMDGFDNRFLKVWRSPGSYRNFVAAISHLDPRGLAFFFSSCYLTKLPIHVKATWLSLNHAGEVISMELKPEKFKNTLPLPVTLITTCNAQGLPNAAPYSCVMPVLRPLDLIAFASDPANDTLINIHENGQFVVNVFGKPSFKKAISCSKNYPFGVDELKEIGLETTSSKRVDPPRVREAVGWIEANLENELRSDRYVIIVGKVISAEINDNYCKNGELDELPINLLFPYFRSLGEPVARRDEFDV